MKKGKLINAPLSGLIAELGHLDCLVIGDAGLPTGELRRIDLALTPGVPSFIETVRTILVELSVERAIIAQEMETHNPEIYKELLEALGDISIEKVSHKVFKIKMQEAKAVVRTGEFSPYANVILICGVVF